MRELKILGGVTLKAKFAFANILMDFFFFLFFTEATYHVGYYISQ